ncbi:MAG: DUF3604 domain-containing protein, partial [Armatimonadetes bacterium]|nr:DUF3604 domain-containing protein [Armatimonadota bacterium]
GNPIVADVSGTKPIYWGVLNGRAGYTEGWGDGADSYFRYGREIAGLDYLALSEPVGAAVAPARQAGGRSNDDRSSGGVGGLYACRYGRYLSADEVLRTTLDAARRHHRSGEFVTVAGYMGSTEAAGPHGVYWADPGGHGGDMVPKRMLGFPFEIEHALGATEALVVHHLNAGYLPYSSLSEGRTRAGAVQSPVIECYSDQGMAFPGPGPRDPMVGGVRTAVAKSLFRVIGRGLRFGLVGDSGTLTGWPGRRYPCGVSRRGRFLQGLTACRATALSREAILRAYRARDVYATTGERISLSFTVGGVGMGRAVRSDGPLTATVVVAGTAPISEINLFNGERVLSQARVAGKRDARVVFDLPTPKAAEMPYLVEVVQTDRHRAWSSPIWVQKRSAPDLAWKVGPKGSLILRNAGSAPTSRIVLRGHRTAYGFVRPGWKPEPKVVEGADGQVWLRRWTDTRATLFVVWRGARMDGTLRLEGHAAYDPEPFLSLFAKWSDSAPGGTFRDDGKGLMEFADGSAANRGLGVNVTVSSKRACVARLTTAREVALRVDGHTERGREFTIALNRYADGGRTVVVPALAPGAQYAMPDASLCWMADPDNAIAEISESNNLWTPSARK